MTEQREWLKASHRKCAVSVWRRQVVQVFVFKYITDRQSQKMNAILHTRIVQNKLHEQKLISRILLQWRGGGFIWWECASNFLKCFSACDSMWYKVAQQASSVCKFLQDFPHTSAPPRATVIFLWICTFALGPRPAQVHHSSTLPGFLSVTLEAFIPNTVEPQKALSNFFHTCSSTPHDL